MKRTELPPRRVTTADGSTTFHSREYDEHYHSKSGAKEESFKKYVEPCRIEALAKEGHVAILDFCFGLGYNACAALDTAFTANPNCVIDVWALEKDDGLLQELLTFDGPFKSYELIHDLLKNRTHTGYLLRSGNITIKMLVGDGRETMKGLPSAHFDAIFFDPFSPPKNPELWTVEVFREMVRTMGQQAVLATYSCARTVRDAMKAAGLIVKDGPVVGRRSPSTLCTLPAAERKL